LECILTHLDLESGLVAELSHVPLIGVFFRLLFGLPLKLHFGLLEFLQQLNHRLCCIVVVDQLLVQNLLLQFFTELVVCKFGVERNSVHFEKRKAQVLHQLLQELVLF
jgi:hypothetical protein